MNTLTRIQQLLIAAGALLMVVGAGTAVFASTAILPAATLPYAAGVFTAGALAFALTQACCQTYNGQNSTVRRLRRIMVIGDALFVIAALLLLENTFHWLFPLVATTIDGYNMYVHIVYNNWVLALLLAAIFELYTTHRIAAVLRKTE